MDIKELLRKTDRTPEEEQKVKEHVQEFKEKVAAVCHEYGVEYTAGLSITLLPVSTEEKTAEPQSE